MNAPQPPGQPGPGGLPPSPAPGQPGGVPAGASPGGPPAAQQSTNGKAIGALVCGILSIVCLGFIAGIVGIILGRQAKEEIARGEGGGAGMAQVGYVLSIIGTILSVLGLLLWIILVVAAGSN